jgi:hypothetical protein
MSMLPSVAGHGIENGLDPPKRGPKVGRWGFFGSRLFFTFHKETLGDSGFRIVFYVQNVRK